MAAVWRIAVVIGLLRYRRSGADVHRGEAFTVLKKVLAVDCAVRKDSSTEPAPVRLDSDGSAAPSTKKLRLMVLRSRKLPMGKTDKAQLAARYFAGLK